MAFKSNQINIILGSKKIAYGMTDQHIIILFLATALINAEYFITNTINNQTYIVETGSIEDTEQEQQLCKCSTAREEEMEVSARRSAAEELKDALKYEDNSKIYEEIKDGGTDYDYRIVGGYFVSYNRPWMALILRKVSMKR